MLPVLSRAIGQSSVRPQGASKLLRSYVARLTAVSDELRSLSQFLNAPVMAASAEAVEQVCKKVADAEMELARPDLHAASMAVESAVNQLERVKMLLDQQSPLKFRLWLWNPWLYYPRRIGSPLSGRSKKPKSLER
jgi:hypothetical protein